MIGKYYKILSNENNYFDIYFVTSINDDYYTVWNFSSNTFDENGMLNFRKEFHAKQWNGMIANKEIIEINPPTFFVVTSKNTYEKREEIKKAGGKWSITYKMWYFLEKPNRFATKEVILFPYTGKRL